MDSKIATAIAETLSEVIERPVAQVTSEMRFDQDFDLDSYMFVQFLLGLEDRVAGLRFDPESIGHTEFNLIGGLADYIAKQVALVPERANP